MRICAFIALLNTMTYLVSLGDLPKVKFQNSLESGEPIHATGVLLDNEILATVALHQASPNEAFLVTAEGKESKLDLVLHDAISRITLYKLSELQCKGLDKVDKFVSLSDLKAGALLHAHIAGKNTACRMVSFVRRFNGRILPVTFIRANIQGQEIVAGSPVYNPKNELVGLAYQMREDKKSFYILPAPIIEHLKGSIATIGSGKLYRPCWIGISMDHQSDAPQVIGVRPGAPAHTAGIKKGDIILSIGDQEAVTYPELVNALYFLKKGKPTTFTLLRGVETKEVMVTPTLNPLLH